MRIHGEGLTATAPLVQKPWTAGSHSDDKHQRFEFGSEARHSQAAFEAEKSAACRFAVRFEAEKSAAEGP